MKLDFVEFYSGYASYHNNIVNRIIHLICIPQILFSLFALIMHYSFRRDVINSDYFEINAVLICTCILICLYMYVEPITGLATSILTIIFFIANNYIYNLYEAKGQLDLHFKIFLAQQIIAWVLQFIGHGVFEKRKPALLDNILQVLVAPDFVVIEIFFFFGYRRDLSIKCEKRVQELINEYKKKQIKSQ